MKRGEVWYINLEPTVGAELRKTRPAVIVNDDTIGTLPLKVIVPITDWKEHYDIAPWMVKVEPENANGLSKTSAVDTFQIRSVSQLRLSHKIGVLSDENLQNIEVALATVLKIKE